MKSRLLLPIVVALVSAAACKAKKDAFYAEVFPCSTPGPGECGTTEDGAPMTCFSAKGLGGQLFCAESCDPHGSPSRPGTTCTSSGALLVTCEPKVDGDASGGCPAGLSCYRTSLSDSRGVCLAMNVCSADSDCAGTSRPTCAASIIQKVLPPAVAATAATDHLHCVQTGCKTSNMSCPVGEVCIGSYLSFGLPVDDACVPGCDETRPCPPNFTCLRDALTAPGGPPMCFPGMVGARCSAPENCLAGQCTDVGVEFGVCSVPCRSDLECKALNTLTDVFVCVGAPAGHCLTPRPFQGSNCSTDAQAMTSGVQCPAGQQCFDESPYGILQHGECRVPCDADGKCPARGGLPHVCLGASHDGGCYPSSFGTPCASDTDCIADFKCLAAQPDDAHSRTGYSAKICTIPCGTDADCDADTWIKKRGYCSGEGLCRLGGGDGSPCDRAAQCESHRCDVPTMTCVAPAMAFK
jgi:hypothetical protein